MLKNLSNPKDFWSGVMFLAIGLGFAFIARTYTLGTANRMGPGFFPFYLGLIMAGLGVVILFNSLRSKGEAVEKFHWQPILWVLGSIVMFGVLLKAVGMIVAGILLVCGSSLGGEEFKVKGTLILAFVLVVFCSLVFVFGLKLPIPMCPDVEWFQQIRLCRV
jgi:formate hydrogenlyase subunit 3/multisubunit Na+/H+ antiporter MnhD subunit